MDEMLRLWNRDFYQLVQIHRSEAKQANPSLLGCIQRKSHMLLAVALPICLSPTRRSCQTQLLLPLRKAMGRGRRKVFEKHVQSTMYRACGTTAMKTLGLCMFPAGAMVEISVQLASAAASPARCAHTRADQCSGWPSA